MGCFHPNPKITSNSNNSTMSRSLFTCSFFLFLFLFLKQLNFIPIKVVLVFIYVFPLWVAPMPVGWLCIFIFCPLLLLGVVVCCVFLPSALLEWLVQKRSLKNTAPCKK